MLLSITQRSQADRALTNLPLYIADRGAASLWLFRSLILLRFLMVIPFTNPTYRASSSAWSLRFIPTREKKEKKKPLRITKSAVSPRYPTHENHESGRLDRREPLLAAWRRRRKEEG